MGKNLKGKNIGRGICQRKDGLYQAKIYLKLSPKPVYLYDSNLNSLRAKKKHFGQMKSKNYLVDQSLTTLNNFFEHWMETVCAVKLKNTTIRNYYDNYNRIKSNLQNVRLVDLTPSQIQVAINDISKKYKPSTVKSSLSVFIDRSFSPELQEDEMKYITGDMLNLFFEAAKKSRSRFYFCILLQYRSQHLKGLQAIELFH